MHALVYSTQAHGLKVTAFSWSTKYLPMFWIWMSNCLIDFIFQISHLRTGIRILFCIVFPISVNNCTFYYVGYEISNYTWLFVFYNPSPIHQAKLQNIHRIWYPLTIYSAVSKASCPCLLLNFFLFSESFPCAVLIPQ